MSLSGGTVIGLQGIAGGGLLQNLEFGVWSLGFLLCCNAPTAGAVQDPVVLKPSAFAHYVQNFNAMEDENWTNFVSNAQSWNWLRANVPLFECPDREVEEMYYYRWWSFRKHLVQTPGGFVFTEFLTPVRHAGAYNSISCAVGHHLAEGRWLRDGKYLDDYTRFWLQGANDRPQAHFHRYSSWFAAAAYERYLVNGDLKFVVGLLDDLVADYRVWETERQFPSFPPRLAKEEARGLFWQNDVWDGMEESISGSRTQKNVRPTINSYMYGNARAIAAIAQLAGRKTRAMEFEVKAYELKRRVQETLWNPEAEFFEVRLPDGRFSNVREELGFVPWCFDLPDAGREAAWAQFKDPDGFLATYGLTTAERRHPQFRSHGCCKCEWDGAVWPFATSQTLNALANVLRDYSQSFVTSRDYFDAFLVYTRCQHFGGKPYIGEYLDETTGQWLKGKAERSRYYNHSTFADLVITGVVGLRPRADDTVEVYPLLPDGVWDWFCLDGVAYHGGMLTILWDRDGKRYGKGAGLRVLAHGKEVAHADKLGKLTGRLP